MPFRPKKKQPNFATIKSILAQTRTEDNALYQVIQQIIEKLGQFQSVTVDEIADVNNSINNSISILTNKINTTGTYLTVTDERGNLPNSWYLVPGTNIAFDQTVPNQFKINCTLEDTGLGNHYDCPLSDGDLDETNLIYAAGECIIVQVPVDVSIAPAIIS